ncbi:hypothetical protein [Steroidobacter cummioxidans]|uniref:hypothetical protein n=1 Tax=Steroidobacter cummioxidans TaxID=1803913 RepID=UPI000E30D1CB|nr:hypothetical protein [Steroidobacter cummioxidans]
MSRPCRSELSPTESFAAQLHAWHERMHVALARRLPSADESPARLHAALRSWVLDREEREHPILMFAVGRTMGLREERVEVAACALELLHLFVEVHRALPALARDERARAPHPALQAYDEATMLLVGDSLPPLAFNLICVDPDLRVAAKVRLQLAAMLASTTGSPDQTGRAHHCAGVRLAIACRRRPPGRKVRVLLTDFERALALSWSDACAVLPRRGEQVEALRRVTCWLAERDAERGA